MHLFESIVDAVAATLLGNFVRSALAGETGGQRVGVGDSREMIALQKILVI